MLEFITNVTWVIVLTISSLAAVYCLVRLSAIAWHRTKAEYDTLLHTNKENSERKRQNNEEL